MARLVVGGAGWETAPDSDLSDLTPSVGSVSFSATEYSKALTLTNPNSSPVGVEFSVTGADAALVAVYFASDFGGGDTQSTSGETARTAETLGVPSSSGTLELRIGRNNGASSAISDATVSILMSNGNTLDVTVTAAALSLPTPSFTLWDSTYRSASSVSKSAGISLFAGASLGNFINDNFVEEAANSVAFSGWVTDEYFQLDLGTAAVMDGMRVYVGDNVSWAPAGSRTQKATLLGSNDPTFATSDQLADDIEFLDGGFVVLGGDVEEADITDGTTSNWRRTYGWANSTPYRYYRLVFKSGDTNNVYWWTTELTFRVG